MKIGKSVSAPTVAAAPAAAATKTLEDAGVHSRVEDSGALIVGNPGRQFTVQAQAGSVSARLSSPAGT